MNKIIIKKGNSTSWENKTGLILPIFNVVNNEYIKANSDDYPNNGHIFVTVGFEKFEEDSLYELNSDKLQDNTKNYENDLKAYKDGFSSKNPSFKITTNYSGDMRKLPPNEIIPIYPNRFTINSNILLEKDGIKSDVFFLKKSDSIYGPFQRDGNVSIKAATFKDFEDDFENDDTFLAFTESYRQFDGSIVFEFSQNESSSFIIKDNNGDEFLVSFNDFVKNGIGSKIDFTPIPVLHKWAINKLTISNSKLADVLNQLKNIQSSTNNQIDNLKWNKYISVFDEISENEGYIEELVKVLIEKKFIKETIDTSENEKLNKEIVDLKKALESKENANLTLINANKGLQEELKEEKDKIKENNKIDSNLFPKLTEVLNNEEKIKEIENLLIEKTKLTNLQQECWELKGEIKQLKTSKNDIEVEYNKINKNIESISTVFQTKAEDYTAKIAETKIYTDLLNGIKISPIIGVSDESTKITTNIVSLNAEINSAKTYINEMKKRLANQGREFSFNEVANLVITINQTFITIIAGAPGVGKTSLVEKLSKSYGLDEEFGYLEIACAKGWTSSKDLIGFFNPLTNKFQPAKTKLKEALKKSEDNPNAPYIVLLDEANLSPIEHYWSDFIKLADINYARKIKISEKEEIKFGEGFRFIATINHDHTTEALSNRLVDRAAIIQLDKPKEIKDDSTINIDSIFDFTEIQDLFNEPNKKWENVKELIEDTFNKIKERLESNHTIVISPRKENAVYKYCKVATGLFEGNSYVALDYAISQHILPLINGRGESFQNLLKDLKNDLNDKDMKKSEMLLNKIIERGKDLKHFRYIYY